ncbi:MAG: hypothetical protein QXF35_02320 [Candidatus Bilamarchaeaceae archaeon]
MLTAQEIINSALAGFPGDLIANSTLALTTSAILLAFVYIWATLWRNEQMKGSVKLELTELIVSAIMLSFIVMIVGTLNNITIGTVVPSNFIPAGTAPTKNVYDITGDYFIKVKEDILGWVQITYIYNMPIDLMSSANPHTRPLGVGFVSTPLAGTAGPLKQLLRTSMITLVVAYIVNYAQYFTYLFALDAFLKYYLPLGVFLRCFTPTRKVGGSIIAISAVLLIAFPLLITLDYVVLYSDDGPLTSFNNFLTLANITNDLTNTVETIKSMIFGDLTIWTLIFSPVFMIYKFIQNFFGSLFFTVVAFASGIIARAFLIGVMIPLFNTFIFVQTARGLSKSLGEEVDLSSFMRLI